MSIKRLQYWLTLIVVLAGVTGQAQNSLGGQPLSLRENLRSAAVTTLTVPAAARFVEQDHTLPGERFAAALSLDYTPQNSGEWTSLPDGRRVWRLYLRVASAKGLAVFYDQLQLATGAQLFFYRPDGSEIFGAYTATSLAGLDRCWTGFVQGEEAIVEYVVPADTPTHTPFRIWRIDHAYRPVHTGARTPDFEFGASKDCHPNANCDLGDDWQAEKKSLSRVIVVVAEGSGYCTGTLLNNTTQDQTPYVLTGFHCQDGFTPLYDLWRFDFGYQAQACANPADEPAFTSVLGAHFRAGRQQNDVLLLEMFDGIQLANVYFSGWDRRPDMPDTAVILHHPLGDIMKIGRSTAPITLITNVINWNNDVTTPANHHLRVHYTEGSFEAGSSGAALYDQRHRVVGHLHGGNTNQNDCEDTEGFFGRLHMAWEGGGSPDTRLKDWLDPIDSGVDTLDALSTGMNIGTISTATGDPIGGVDLMITVNDVLMVNTTTTTNGTFIWPSLLVDDVVKVSLAKNTDPANGVSVFDQILTSKHLLDVQPFDSPYAMLAADVNNNGSISTADVIQMKKLSLDIDQAFSQVPSWRFVPAQMNVSISNVLSTQVLEEYTFTVEEGMQHYHFIGVKMGDVNGSASPN